MSNEQPEAPTSTPGSPVVPAAPATPDRVGQMHPHLEWAARAVGTCTFIATVTFCAVVGLSWLAAYVCWLLNCHLVFVERVAEPVRFLLRNPPTAGLATLLLAALAVLLFFHPIYDFLHNIESIGPAKRRTGRKTARSRKED